MLSFLATGDWAPGQVRLAWSETSSRRVVPEIEQLIDETWAAVCARPGVHLFDGPMCRMESFNASPERLELALSPTSYKPFVGTNLQNPHLARTHGRDVMANPVGVSTLLETADGFLLLGRRNASVAYYPNRLHPFAGALEPRDGSDPFAAVRRELKEELGLGEMDVSQLRCAGLVEDGALVQPELIFLARSPFAKSELEARLDDTEHNGTFAIPARLSNIDADLNNPEFTPVAAAAILHWARLNCGDDVFRRLLTQFVS